MGTTKILVLIDLVQDFDVLAPVLTGLGQFPDIELRIIVSRWLITRAPRIAQGLGRLGLRFGRAGRSDLLAGRGPPLVGIDMVLSASESSAGPHRWCRALVVRARAQGIACFTLQHGLDNLEILAAPAHRRQDIASDVMFCWPPEAEWPPGLPPEARARLASVGRATATPPGARPTYDVGIFENLHAARYTDQDRQLTLARILGLARLRPQLRLCVRSHPAGGWLDKAADKLASADNIVFTPSGRARREDADGLTAVARATRVITTPSTVALDAAQIGRPTALALDGGELYRPLPVLDGLSDWVRFADTPTVPSAESGAFVARSVAPGDAVARIVDRIVTFRRQAI